MIHHKVLTIPIPEEDGAFSTHTWTLSTSWLAEALEECEKEGVLPGTEGSLDVEVSKSGLDVVVQGSLSASVCLPCARCLEPFSLSLSASVSALLIPEGAMSRDAAEEGDENTELEIDVLTYTAGGLFLDDLVRDELILSIPMFPLCREECKGASFRHTEAKSVVTKPLDERLAPLALLKEKKKFSQKP